MSRGWSPRAGDLISINFDPQAGHEQAGHRLALVLSEASYNSTVGLAIICPITNQAKGYPFEVLIPRECNVTGVVLSDQVKSIDWRARRAKRLDTAPASVIDAVRRHISLILCF